MNTSRGPLAILGLAALLAATALAPSARGDEIRLKDGKKLHGVIVSYEDNMFKVKTDFGYVLVEKDKIAAIIPDTPADSTDAKAALKPAPKTEPATSKDAATGALTPAVETSKQAKTATITNAAVRPEIPLTATKSDATPPAIKPVNATPKTALASPVAPPPPPKVEPPPVKEEVQGNLYINHEYAFRMYKAPSWEIIGDAGQTLPNAIVAMGTNNESTLLVVGYEKSKTALEPAAKAVEKKLSEVYDNYRLISQRTAPISGMPAVEYHYRGLADGHDWSGTLAVVARNGEIFTVLGMTYADTDLIQIQENVITRAVTSLEFTQK